MTWSQTLVIGWLQFAVAAACLLLVARMALLWVSQPADRIRLIQCALLGALAVPVLLALAPWRLEIIARERETVAKTLPAAASDPTPGELGIGEPLPITADSIPWSPQDLAAGLPVKPDSSSESRSVSPAAVRARVFPGWSLAALAIAVVHGLAASWFAIQWVIGAARLRRLMLTASGAPQSVHDAWQTVSKGRGTGVKLLLSPAIESPLTFGWFRPVVILPRETVASGNSALGYCLAHEWAHIERADILSWHAMFACQIFLWHQPLFWTLRRELRLCQDLLADDRSAAANDAIEYSELLVSFAKKRLAGSLAGALTFLDHPSQLTRRVKMLLERPVAMRPQCTWKFSIAALIVALTLAGAVGVVRLDVARAQEEVKQPTAAPKEKPAEQQEKPAEKPAEPPVRLAYTGVILDKSTGKGIPDATVVVRRSSLRAGENKIIEETTHKTNAEGKYSFEIPPEQVAMRYLYIELDVDHENFAARKGFGYALSMIRKNEGLGERPFFERVELEPAEPITGTLLAPDGKPAADVKLLGYSKANPGDFREYGSFTNAQTTAEGKFRLNMIKGGDGVYWILPKDYAITQKFIGKQRGDLGEIRLQPGIRVSGRVLSIEGKPVAGVAVNIDSQSREDLGGLNVGSSVHRGAISNEEGHFAFDPLPAGDYRVMPSEHLNNPLARDRTTYPVPGVFLPRKVTLKEGAAPAALEIQAAPHVVFNAQYFDGKGEKTTGHELFLFGQMDGEFWFGQGRPNTEGTIALRVPHGLQQVQVQLMTNEHGALRYRLGADKPLQNERRNISFGTLNDDVEGFQIIRYKAPIVLVKAVDEEGQPVKGFQLSATYPWGKQEYILEGERRSDISFEKQDDGRYRTSQMLPDEEVTFTVTATGYQTVSEKRTLAEGETQDVVLTLKKASEKKEE